MNVEVNPGWSVITPEKTYLPGECLELDDAEARRLINAGMVKEPNGAGSKSPSNLNVIETVKLVMATATVEALEAFKENEVRKGVLDAIDKRRAELEKPAGQ